jgi:hypothetical protein
VKFYLGAKRGRYFSVKKQRLDLAAFQRVGTGIGRQFLNVFTVIKE